MDNTEIKHIWKNNQTSIDGLSLTGGCLTSEEVFLFSSFSSK